MHKAVILLTKAENKEEALNKVRDFLEPYGEGRVWDWYDIGGRWSGSLAPKYNECDDHYNLPEDGGDYDVLRLWSCLDNVKEWWFNSIEKGKELEKEANKWLDETWGSNNFDMYGYALKKAGNIYSQDFCFDCNVFNIEDNNYNIPEITVGWWAVIVDMHN